MNIIHRGHSLTQPLPVIPLRLDGVEAERDDWKRRYESLSQIHEAAAIDCKGYRAEHAMLREALKKIDADLEGRNFLESSSLRDTARAALEESRP